MKKNSVLRVGSLIAVLLVSTIGYLLTGPENTYEILPYKLEKPNYQQSGWLASQVGQNKHHSAVLIMPDQAFERLPVPRLDRRLVAPELVALDPSTDPQRLPVPRLDRRSQEERLQALNAEPLRLYYTIRSGDVLSVLFSRFNLGQSVMYRMLEADYEVLALDTLMPGDKVVVSLDRRTHRLEKFELVFHAAHRVIYSQQNDGNFETKEIRLKGDWRPEAVETEIRGSFSLSAERAGLKPSDVSAITELMKEKLDFRRQLKAGDRVQVLNEVQYVDGEATGQRRLMAVIFKGRNWQRSAFLHSDGSYYDHEGRSLTRAFMRVPVKGKYRLTSHFNPKRLHPVTKRITAHKGTDFAAPQGTPILAAGDGRVVRVENHPIAGKYVEIEHHGAYKTRYMHLHTTKVTRGQTVSREQVIGTMGRTGRVTGVHLHYELLINGRAVDAMKADIPTATMVSKDERKAFLTRVMEYQATIAANTNSDLKPILATK